MNSPSTPDTRLSDTKAEITKVDSELDRAFLTFYYDQFRSYIKKKETATEILTAIMTDHPEPRWYTHIMRKLQTLYSVNGIEDVLPKTPMNNIIELAKMVHSRIQRKLQPPVNQPTHEAAPPPAPYRPPLRTTEEVGQHWLKRAASVFAESKDYSAVTISLEEIPDEFLNTHTAQGLNDMIKEHCRSSGITKENYNAFLKFFLFYSATIRKPEKATKELQKAINQIERVLSAIPKIYRK